MTASPSAGEQRKFLANTIKPGGVAGVPESYYRKALDLNRFSNSVANKLLESYRRQIVKAVRELERIDKMPSSKKPQFKAARMRALIKQNLDAMKKWSGQSVEELIKQLDGLADVEVAFARAELQRVVPAAVKTQVRTVEVTESFAKAVVKADPLDVGTNLLQGSFEEAVKGPGSVMKLTARQGAVIRMPDGTSIVKAFRGLAERQGELFSRAVLDGLLTGESTESIARSLFGELGFSTEALTPRQVALAQKGNAWKMAKHQVRTLVRTSVNATSNAASLQVYKANPNLTKKYRWIATLDSNTTAICRNLDQKEFFYGKGPTPSNPPHFGCRSTTVPVVDYEGASKKFGVEIKPPSTKIGYRPTKEGTPSSADPKGGRVPVGTSAAQHLYDLRGTTKAGRKSRFEASPAQARMLNGGKATPGAFEKARYFNRLADRYGPEGAMKRFMREDGSEVSLKQLRSRYGDPEKITRAKKAPTPKPKPKLKAAPKPVPKPKATAKPKAAAKAKAVPANLDAQISAKQAEFKKLNYELLTATSPKDIKAIAAKATAAKNELEALKLKDPAYAAKQKAAEKALKKELQKAKDEVDLPPALAKARPPREALKRYTGETYREMRAEQFRQAKKAGKKLSPFEEAQIKIHKKNGLLADEASDIEAFLKRAPKHKGEVYRTMITDQKGLEDMLAGYKGGNQSLAMESWTSDSTLEFAQGRGQRVMLRTQNKKGVDISQLSEFEKESEVLMPQGVKYKLKSVTKEEISARATKEGRFSWIVDLEQL